jgi:hypothetical protein
MNVCASNDSTQSSGFDCPSLVLLAEPLVECDPLRRPTAAEALVWFHKWCERVGVVLPNHDAERERRNIDQSVTRNIPIIQNTNTV